MNELRDKEALNRAVESMLDFFASAVDGKDDDEIVDLNAEINALADACGVDHVEALPPTTAGKVRERIREGRAALR